MLTHNPETNSFELPRDPEKLAVELANNPKERFMTPKIIEAILTPITRFQVFLAAFLTDNPEIDK